MFKRLTIVSIFLAVSFFAWFFLATRPVTNQQVSPVEFEVKSGWGIDRIGQELSAAKLIRSRTAFKVSVVVLGLQNNVQAGYFRFSPSMSITEIAQSLTRASTKQVRVTIPEGLRRQEIAQILETSFKNYEDSTFSSSEFLSLTAEKEGRLFPDTYDFDPKASAEKVLEKLDARFTAVISELKISEDQLNKTLVTASLLEREAASSEEMPEIAGVIANRLEAGWPLQIDATVQYALASSQCKKIDCNWWPNNLTKANLQINSPYNTFQNQGLPPRPISNPGKAAIKAASSPQKTSAWFYIHDNQGKIHFSDTVEEHNQNICTYLKKDC